MTTKVNTKDARCFLIHKLAAVVDGLSPNEPGCLASYFAMSMVSDLITGASDSDIERALRHAEQMLDRNTQAANELPI